MSTSEDFIELQDTLNAIPDEQVKEPTIPVGIFVQESEDLAAWAYNDVQELSTVGITEETIAAIKVGAGALRETQSMWVKYRNTMEAAQQQWNNESPVAYHFRDELIHDFRYAFRGSPELISRIDQIASGSGHADMFQDLNDLSVLGKANTGLLEAIGFDLLKLDAAAATADRLSEILAVANGIKLSSNPNKLMRDRAYTHLKFLTDEVRNAGKYKFWHTPSRLKGYISQFWRKKNETKKTREINDETIVS